MCLVPEAQLPEALLIRSHRDEALRSHHFVVTAEFRVEMPHGFRQRRAQPRRDIGRLKDSTASKVFSAAFSSYMHSSPAGPDSGKPGALESRLRHAMQAAAEDTLPELCSKPSRPWISHRTLELIDDRASSRPRRDGVAEARLNRMIKASARKDRRTWLDELVQSGDFSAVRKLWAGPSRSQGRMKNQSGILVESDERAEAMATHLESV